jgi:hypothetical protein
VFSWSLHAPPVLVWRPFRRRRLDAPATRGP